MQNEGNELIDIMPYTDSFLFFLNYEPMNSKYKTNFNRFMNDDNFLSDFLYKFSRKIIVDESDNEEIKQKKLIFQKSPQKAFNILLSELHKMYIGKEVNNYKTKTAENNKENAYLLFKKYIEQDKSFISENFYGIKSIEKKCKICKNTNYIYKYLKTIPITIKNITEETRIDFEKCIKQIQKKFTMKEFCPFCADKENLEIKIKIEKYPKLLIFVLFGNEKYVKFKIKNSIKNGEYELIAAEIKNQKNICDYFSPFINGKKNYQFIYNEPVNEEIFVDNIPIVLFYKKRAQMLFEKETGPDSRDSFVSSDKATENYEVINSEDIKINKCVEKSGNLKEKEIEKEKERGKVDISLNFRFEKTEKNYSIDTNNLETFKNIIKNLKNKYKDINDIGEDKIIFNNKVIIMDKTPKDYNMKGKIDLIILE